MTTFNTTAVDPGATFGNSSSPSNWSSASDPGSLLVSQTPAPNNWGNSVNTVNSVGNSLVTVVAPSAYARSQYTDGYKDGELYGFSSQREEDMEPIQLGETDDDLKTISFMIYDSFGFPASGNSGEGAVASPVTGQVQVNRDLTGYVNSAGVFTHIADGEYRYTFANSEVASGGGEGNVWFRAKISGFRTVTIRVPIRDLATSAKVRDAVLNAVRSGFAGTGTIGEGIAIASSLLQGNFLMDMVTDGPSGQTSSRIRCFHTGAAAAAATSGGSGEGEFATFIVTTTYSGANKIATHRAVQQ
jgi:hypothetical protein